MGGRMHEEQVEQDLAIRESPCGWVRTGYDPERGWLWRKVTHPEAATARITNTPAHLLPCDDRSA